MYDLGQRPVTYKSSGLVMTESYIKDLRGYE